VVCVMREPASQHPAMVIDAFRSFWARDERRSSSPALAAAWPASAEKTAAGYLWAYDFAYDACAKGQQLKCLAVIDEYTPDCSAIDVAGSLRSGRVIEVLSKWVSVHGTQVSA